MSRIFSRSTERLFLQLLCLVCIDGLASTVLDLSLKFLYTVLPMSLCGGDGRACAAKLYIKICRCLFVLNDRRPAVDHCHHYFVELCNLDCLWVRQRPPVSPTAARKQRLRPTASGLAGLLHEAVVQSDSRLLLAPNMLCSCGLGFCYEQGF